MASTTIKKGNWTDVSSLITWNSTYVADHSGISAKTDGKLLIISGTLKLVESTTTNFLNGAFIATLDNSIACVASQIVSASFAADNTNLTAFLKPVGLYMHDTTRMRISNSGSSTTAALGNPAANNSFRIDAVLFRS